MIDKTSKPTGREDDYRDYEERNLDDGWPYADAASGSETKPGNGAYGEAPENFDERGNPGFQSSDETVIESSNGPDLFGDDAEGDVDDDGREEAIGTALEESDVDISAVEIKVRRGIALLTGAVETREESLEVQAIVERTRGIVEVRNRLTMRAVDGNIPSDWDE